MPGTFLSRLPVGHALSNMRHRAFVRIAYIFSAMIACEVVIAIFLFPETRFGVVVGGAVAAAFLGLGEIARRTGALVWPVRLFVATAVIGTALASSVNGGVTGHVAPFFVATPIMAGYFLGLRSAAVTCAAVIGVALLLTIGEISGWVIDTPSDPQKVAIISFVVLTIAILLVVAAAASYAGELSAYATRLEQDRSIMAILSARTPVAVAMFDSDLKCMGASDLLARYLGKARKDMIGLHHSELLPDENGFREDVLQRCMAGVAVGRQDERVLDDEGREIWVQWEAQPWRNLEGAIGGCVAAAHDVTEDVRKQRELETAHSRAAAASEAKTRYLSDISHEMRTPLNGVLGMAQLLKSTSLSQRQKIYVDGVLTAGDAMRSVINGVLDLSNIEAGVINLKSDPFNVEEVLEQATEACRPMALEKNLALHSHVRMEGSSRFLGDRDRVRQVLIGLIENAVKYTPEGSVVVSAGLDRAGRLLFCVEDTGPGVPEEHRERIFERFHRGAGNGAASTVSGGAGAPANGGSGLGLTIARDIVQLMGGEIQVKDAPSGGALVWFALPIPVALDRSAVERSSLAGLGSSISEHDVESISVLLAEDNELNQLVVQEVFADEPNIELDIVADGPSVLEKIGDKHFDVLLLDICMPRMSGDEVIHRLRTSEGAGRDIPIIVLSANALNDQSDKYIALGATDCLTKPIDFDELRRLVCRYGLERAA